MSSSPKRQKIDVDDKGEFSPFSPFYSAFIWVSFITFAYFVLSGSDEVKVEVKEEPEEAKPDLVMPEGEGEDADDERKRKVPSAPSSDAPTPPPSSTPQGLNRSGSVDLPLPSTSETSSTTVVKQGSLHLTFIQCIVILSAILCKDLVP